MGRKVITIIGPTCSGKTDLAIDLAIKLKSEIISADSRQVYKYLNIGTAKPTSEQLKKIKHYFIDELEPDIDFNVSKFEVEALEIIEKIFLQEKIPIVVGGSGLYIKALIDGIFNTVDVDIEYRNYLKNQKEIFGNEFLYEELKKVDPITAEKLQPQNWKRIIRALEVFKLTGVSIWQWQKNYKREININFIQFGLEWDRNILYKNINNRVERMVESGLVDEVKNILKMGYSSELNSLNTVGYKEIISFLNNEITLEKAIELIKRNTRRFAKRQLTWFKKDKRITWFKINSFDEISFLSEKIIKLI
ncbi:MAG: tRNA (adenosine(37)-N6)-dimethylallyltransferase MiaA [Ignavibacterium sp.]